MVARAPLPHPSTLFAEDEVLTRRQLLARGATVTQLAAAAHDGSLVRIRRGYYCLPDLDSAVQRAVRVGGRVSCRTELRRRPSDHAHVSLFDALLAALNCLPEREALAALDSALNLRMLSQSGLDSLASALPAARRHLVDWADRAGASGIETFVRFLCLVMGLKVRTQPVVPGVGRGDLEIERVLIVEADGREFHDAEVTARDRRRDAGYVRAGFTPLHFRYAQIVYEPREVAETILAALVAHRGFRNSGEIVRRARRRLDKAGIS